jgi:hypothetical protein
MISARQREAKMGFDAVRLTHRSLTSARQVRLPAGQGALNADFMLLSVMAGLVPAIHVLLVMI